MNPDEPSKHWHTASMKEARADEHWVSREKNGHADAMFKFMNRDKMAATFEQAVCKSITMDQDAIMVIISAAYWLATQQSAMAKGASLLDFLKFHGASASHAYRDAAAIREFTVLLGKVVRLWRLVEMGAAGTHYLGLMIDEGTDIGWEHVLILYYKWVTASGRVRTQYAGLIELKGKTAELVFEGLEQRIEDDQLEWEQLASHEPWSGCCLQSYLNRRSCLSITRCTSLQHSSSRMAPLTALRRT